MLVGAEACPGILGGMKIVPSNPPPDWRDPAHVPEVLTPREWMEARWWEHLRVPSNRYAPCPADRMREIFAARGVQPLDVTTGRVLTLEQLRDGVDGIGQHFKDYPLARELRKRVREYLSPLCELLAEHCRLTPLFIHPVVARDERGEVCAHMFVELRNRHGEYFIGAYNQLEYFGADWAGLLVSLSSERKEAFDFASLFSRAAFERQVALMKEWQGDNALDQPQPLLRHFLCSRIADFIARSDRAQFGVIDHEVTFDEIDIERCEVIHTDRGYSFQLDTLYGDYEIATRFDPGRGMLVWTVMLYDE